MKAVELKKSCMAFELKSGELLLISREDITEIATQLVVEMMINKQTHVHIHKGSSIEKCNLLYKAITEQPKMPKKIRDKYLMKIAALIDDGKEEINSFGERRKA